MSGFAFAGWSAGLAVVCLAAGVFIGTMVAPPGSGTTSVSEGRVVQSVDLTKVMDEERRRMLNIFSDDPQRSLEEQEFHRHLLTHNTNYYDTINSLTVVKSDGWIYTFNVQSYKILPDTSLVFVGSQNEQLTYPASGSGWKITGAAEQNAHSNALFSRRRRNTEREDAASDEAMRALTAGRRLSQESSLCDASVDSPCKTCIESQDSWCANSDWDKFCKAGCDGPTDYMAEGCEQQCAEAPIISVKAKKVDEIEKEEPVDCAVGPWSEYSSCAFLGENGVTNDPICIEDRSCGCRQKHTRAIDTQPVHGGAVCPMLEKMEDCDCPKVAGDGHLVDGEECDDGNLFNGDGCSSTMKVEAGWSCSDSKGNPNGNTFTPSRCVAASCGDGVRSGTEECDDGNNDDFDANGVKDGCSSDCKVQTWYDCDGGIGSKSSCVAMRVRKDWRDMEQWEKDRYIEAVNLLKANGVYDLIVQTHAHLPNKNFAHGTSGFLPWHRKYLMEYENALRALGPKYESVTVPYWDWAEDTDICAANGGCKRFDDHSTILQDFGGPGHQACSTYPHSGTVNCDNIPTDTSWDQNADAKNGDQWKNMCKSTNVYNNAWTHEDFKTSCNGMETWGSTGAGATTCTDGKMKFDGCVKMKSSQVGCVMTGPFAGWMSPEYPDTKETTKTCLTRGVNWEIASQGYLTGSQRLQEIITSNAEYGSNGGFRAYIESTPHANPHNLLGGHIRSFSSPADPLFFSHHAFIDKVWSMWQNCHDHDEETFLEQNTPQYKATNANVDGADKPMVFEFPPASTAENNCVQTNEDCANFVASKDSWCMNAAGSGNPWDATCEGFCGDKSATACHNTGGRIPSDMITSWYDGDLVNGEKGPRPGKYHSIHDMPNGNSYLYAPDQFDQKMGAQGAICNYVESAHHGKMWKENRRLGKSVPLNDEARKAEHPIFKTANIHKAAGDHETHRKLTEIGVDIYGCPGAMDGSWSSSAVDYNGDGIADCALHEVNEFGVEGKCIQYTCVCLNGMMWNADYSKCISIYPDDYEVSDPDLAAVLDYYEEYASKLMSENEFVKPSDSLNAVLNLLVDRECKLLYNEKSNIKRIDDVQDDSLDNGPGKRPGSDKFNFLKGWGLEEVVKKGIADDKCNNVGEHVVIDEDDI